MGEAIRQDSAAADADKSTFPDETKRVQYTGSEDVYDYPDDLSDYPDSPEPKPKRVRSYRYAELKPAESIPNAPLASLLRTGTDSSLGSLTPSVSSMNGASSSGCAQSLVPSET